MKDGDRVAAQQSNVLLTGVSSDLKFSCRRKSAQMVTALTQGQESRLKKCKNEAILVSLNTPHKTL